MKRRESLPFQKDFRSVHAVTIWKALGTCIWTRGADEILEISHCLENGTILYLPRCSRHEISDSLQILCYACSGPKSDTEHMASLPVITVCKMSWVLGVMAVHHSCIPPGSSFTLPMCHDCQLAIAYCCGEMNVS